jgi:hypothetical protein
MMLLRTTFPVAVLLALVCAPAAAATVNLPAGTQVMVHSANEISSGNATAGQRFTIQAASPVVVNGRVLITKGASGAGRVVSVSKAHGKSAGQMAVEFLNLHAADGSLVTLSSDSHAKGNAEKGKASTATIISTAILGPIGLFAHNMVKGKDVVIGPTRNFSAWVKTTTTVNVH